MHEVWHMHWHMRLGSASESKMFRSGFKVKIPARVRQENFPPELGGKNGRGSSNSNSRS